MIDVDDDLYSGFPFSGFPFSHTVDPLAIGPTVVVMGEAGTERLDVVRRVASALDAELIDADALHPPETLAKVLAGDALFGDERRLWLDEIAARLGRPGPAGRVVSCTPLRYVHRSILRRAAPQALFFRLHDASRERTGMPLIGTEQFYTTDAFRPQEQGFAVPRMSPARAASAILDCVPESITGPSVAPIAETVA